jgi:hypothetical protein
MWFKITSAKPVGRCILFRELKIFLKGILWFGANQGGERIMGFGRLNIWIRDKHCKVFDARGYVTIKTCDGKVLEWCGENYGRVWLNCGHAEVKVPPGCYIVRARVCYHHNNDDTDRAMVIVGCDEDACVNLIAPTFHQCVRAVVPPFLRIARELDMPEKDVELAVATLMKAAAVSKDEMDERIGRRIEDLKDEEEKDVKEHRIMLEEVRGIIKGMW